MVFYFTYVRHKTHFFAVAAAVSAAGVVTVEAADNVAIVACLQEVSLL